MNNSARPSVSFEAVVPSDTVNFPRGAPRAIYVGGIGNVVAISQTDDEAVTFIGVPAGTILPIQPTRINSTSTTATSMVALY